MGACMSRWDNLDEATAWRDACQAALDSAITGGTTTVAHGGRTVVYASIPDLQRAAQLAQDMVNRLNRRSAGDYKRAGASLVDFT